MSKKILCLLAFLIAQPFALQAQVKKVSPTEIPRAQPVEKKKPGLFKRIFSKTPTPAPTAIPVVKPTTPPRKKKSRSVNNSANPEAQSATNPQPTPTPLPTASASIAPPPIPVESGELPASLPPLNSDLGTLPPIPAPEEPSNQTTSNIPNEPAVTIETVPPPPIPDTVRANPLNQPIPLIDGVEPGVSIPAEPSPKDIREREAIQRAQFQKVRAQVIEDPEIRKLQQEATQAANPTDRAAAFKKFYAALFSAMRKADGTLGVQIDEMEAASRRRVESLISGSTSSVAPSTQ